MNESTRSRKKRDAERKALQPLQQTLCCVEDLVFEYARSKLAALVNECQALDAELLDEEKVVDEERVPVPPWVLQNTLETTTMAVYKCSPSHDSRGGASTAAVTFYEVTCSDKCLVCDSEVTDDEHHSDCGGCGRRAHHECLEKAIPAAFNGDNAESGTVKGSTQGHTQLLRGPCSGAVVGQVVVQKMTGRWVVAPKFVAAGCTCFEPIAWGLPCVHILKTLPLLRAKVGKGSFLCYTLLATHRYWKLPTGTFSENAGRSRATGAVLGQPYEDNIGGTYHTQKEGLAILCSQLFTHRVDKEIIEEVYFVAQKALEVETNKDVLMHAFGAFRARLEEAGVSQVMLPVDKGRQRTKRKLGALERHGKKKKKKKKPTPGPAPLVPTNKSGQQRQQKRKRGQ